MTTSRRSFLVSGIGLAAGAALGCTRPRVRDAGGEDDVGPIVAEDVSSPAADARPIADDVRPVVHVDVAESVRPADAADLRKRFGADVLMPGDADWDRMRKVRNRAFDGVQPRALVFPRDAAGVRDAVAWAVAAGVPVVPRNGAHSYTGQSTSEGLVVSLAHLSGATVDKTAMTADVAAGSMLIDVDHALLSADVGLPTGSCPSVGVAGLTLGGGIGFSSRKWGLMCDNLVGVTLVTADGRTIEADAKNHPEVLWAHKGGGGGQFGIVTSLRFRVHPVEPITQFSARWPWKDADKVLAAWQEMTHSAPDELFAVCMLARGKDEPQVLSHGRWFGKPADVQKVLAPLFGVAKPLKTPEVYATTLWKTNVTECLPDPSDCHAWNHPKPGRYQQASYMVKSDYFDRPFDAEARATLIREVAGIQQQKISWGGIILDGLGGAIGRPAPGDTAWVHRKCLVQAEYVAHWQPSTKPADVAANQAWMRGFYAAMRPFASGQCYQNYPDIDLANWKSAYYGENLARLEAVKRDLDPNGVFRGPQMLGA